MKLTVPLTVLLVTTLLVRVYLVVEGGQYYWPDERLYRASQGAAEFLSSGDFAGAARELARPEHTLFIILGVIPGLAEQVHGASSRIPGLFFCTFSVISIWILWQVALGLGASESEGLLAAILLGCSTTWTYYSRHLLPYDVSMTLGLLALLVVVRNPGRPVHALGCGALGSAAFLAYSGSWAFVAFVMLAGLSMGRHRQPRDLLVRAVSVALGFAVPIALLFGASAFAGRPLLDQYIAFAGTVTQGTFGEGWSLPLEYFWHSEHGLAVLWLASALAAVAALPRGTSRSHVALAGIVFIYLAMVITSVGLEKFVVYGRTARQLVPLLCLVTAQQVFRLSRRYQVGRLHVLVVLLAVVQASLNMRVPLAQVFPDRFKQLALAQYRGTNRDGLLFVFADHIYPTPEPIDVSGAEEIASAQHPLQYVPYQYEGFTPDERRLLRTTDIRMRVVVR